MDDQWREIVLEAELVLPSEDGQSPSMSVDLYSEGGYWFLYPLNKKLQDNHAVFIDLYGDTYFSGGELEILIEFVAEAKALTSKQPISWMQKIGTSYTFWKKRRVTDEVLRIELESWLEDLDLLTKEAKDKNGGILISGN